MYPGVFFRLTARLLLWGLPLSAIGQAVSDYTIPQIQGSEWKSPLQKQTVRVVGVVTASFQEKGQLGGFFIQDPTGDSNPFTSDGLFIHHTAPPQVKAGFLVRVSGTADEYKGLTEITKVTAVEILDSGKNIQPTPLKLPVSSMAILEQHEGMLITIRQPLMVISNENLGTYGELMLGTSRLFHPTTTIDPNDADASGNTFKGAFNTAAVTRQEDLNKRSRLILDDGKLEKNPRPIPYLEPGQPTLRNGSLTESVTGILTYAFGQYRVHPTEAVVFKYAERLSLPPSNPKDLVIASFNVWNFFNGDGQGGGFPTPRGAQSLQELNRQAEKLYAALQALDADIVGLMEIENDGDDAYSAIATLVRGLNHVLGAPVYDYIRDPAEGKLFPPRDEIKVAIIYKKDKVTPVGTPRADTSAVFQRLPLAQTFTIRATGKPLTVIVNHFKSKRCNEATGPNADQGDGQGCYNALRTKQAEALAHFAHHLSKELTGLLLIGDFNSYHEEDPLDLLKASGFRLLTPHDYTFIGQSGEAGSLDHVLVSPDLLPNVTGVHVWHINADEPAVLNYRLENPPALYQPDAYRSSDHDPLIIYLEME
ncbi:MAG: hypothetical protein KatS3mg031_1385 [Chitinophagales bacterium]|nr:MAG: hypothetical protein KatS3mg031_1385 [Chitinophagales bacterium]